QGIVGRSGGGLVLGDGGAAVIRQLLGRPIGFQLPPSRLQPRVDAHAAGLLLALAAAHRLPLPALPRSSVRSTTATPVETASTNTDRSLAAPSATALPASCSASAAWRASRRRAGSSR